MKRIATALLTVIGIAAVARSQETPSPNPMTRGLERLVARSIGDVLEAAEQMPASDYDWRPTPDVRSFGEIVAHLADANRSFCAAASGKAAPIEPRSETTTRKAPQTKAWLIAELRGSLEACKPIPEELDDTALAKVLEFGGGALIDGRPVPRMKLSLATILTILATHTSEHYGNMTTYLRLKSIVPPTSLDIPKMGK
jgi:uncharacterized damage-inducible protein DinB